MNVVHRYTKCILLTPFYYPLPRRPAGAAQHAARDGGGQHSQRSALGPVPLTFGVRCAVARAAQHNHSSPRWQERPREGRVAEARAAVRCGPPAAAGNVVCGNGGSRG